MWNTNIHVVILHLLVAMSHWFVAAVCLSLAILAPFLAVYKDHSLVRPWQCRLASGIPSALMLIWEAPHFPNDPHTHTRVTSYTNILLPFLTPSPVSVILVLCHHRTSYAVKKKKCYTIHCVRTWKAFVSSFVYLMWESRQSFYQSPPPPPSGTQVNGKPQKM